MVCVICRTPPNCGNSELVICVPTQRPLPNVLHLPLLCEDKNGPYVYVQQARFSLAIGDSRPVIATSTTKKTSDLTPLKGPFRSKLSGWSSRLITAAYVSGWRFGPSFGGEVKQQGWS
ncbi:hypothetical protein BDW60DRAFT_209359 [Aspergillus nidulans var. acristatus]